MTQGEKEGVIKFRFARHQGLQPTRADIAELESWRRILFRLGLTGRDASRYDGLSFGNVSRRDGSSSFLITSTQTAHSGELTEDQYCRVLRVDLEDNFLDYCGVSPPSSEALSHAAAYSGNQTVNAVIHVHSPEIWLAAGRLGLMQTPIEVSYGTLAMAAAVEQLTAAACPVLISMAGHEDGILACGESLGSAAAVLLDGLAAALRLDIDA